MDSFLFNFDIVSNQPRGLMKTLLNSLLLLVAALFACPSAGHAQAYCILRDPIREIASLYPDADRLNSIVRTIDKEVYSKMEAKLPAIRLYLSELGRHTLYVPAKGGVAQGIVHPRSEATKFGLVDVVWSLDKELRIRDFRFQRCRGKARLELESEVFKAQVRGKSFKELRLLLDKEGKALSAGGIQVKAEARELAVSVIRCALKTILITELAWPNAMQIPKGKVADLKNP